MYGVDAAILMNQKVWEASGHVSGFADPLIECKKCKHKFRADQIEDKKKCPDCGGELGQEKKFNMMLKTNVGAGEDTASISYLRPETAQGMFVNFKNVIDTLHPKLPFGLAQIGKAFRNEIAPRDFLFRTREFEQMEIEYFVDPKNWEKYFEEFRKEIHNFNKDIGLDQTHVHELEVKDTDRAFYSKRTIDFEFDFPFGRKELYGLAYRTDYDLKQHTNLSGVELNYFDEETKEKYIAHCIEPSFGVDRAVLAVLSDAYTEDNIDGEKRVYMKFSPKIAPVKVAVFPLLKNKPVLVDKAREIYKMLKNIIPSTVFDDNGNIGKRYRRQDEIGTPFCITIDFETVEKGNGVTIRNRDTGKQERIEEKDLIKYITDAIIG
jgi:glycyl-tRNA synthetase